MPALTNSPAFTALDVQDALIAALNADVYIQQQFRTASNVFNPVLDDDPLSIEAQEKALLVVTLAAEGEDDATMGGTNGGTADACNTFAVMVYLWETDNREPATKRQIVQTTGLVRQALMRHRQLSGVPAGGSQSVQLSWTAHFRPQGGQHATVYYTPKNCRLSITLLDVTSRIAYN